jgi:hypothetical protein
MSWTSRHVSLVVLQAFVVRPKAIEHEIAELGLGEARTLTQYLPPGREQLRVHWGSSIGHD